MLLSRPLGPSFGSIAATYDYYSVHRFYFTDSGIQGQDDWGTSESTVLGKCFRL